MKSIDLESNDVNDLPSMKSDRAYLSAALLKDSIYIYGGLDEDDVLVETVEMYDLYF